MKFREMKQTDVEAVFEVRTNTRENHITLERLAALGITPESVSQDIRETSKGWVCEIEGRIGGFTIGEGTSGEVLVIAVLPDAERRGVGQELLELVEDWLFLQGHDQICLMENPDPPIRAHGFYRKAGWEPTGEFRNEDQKSILRKKSEDS